MMTDKAEANMIELSDEMLDDVSGGSLVSTVVSVAKLADSVLKGVGDTAGEAAGTVGDTVNGILKSVVGGLLGSSK
jgi:hypothetical protein